MKRIFSVIICLVLILSLPIAAFAENKDENVLIKEDEAVEGDFFTAGDSVKNMGKVNGDVFAAGTEFENTGRVLGDIILGAGESKIGGRVDGDLRIGTGNLTITGEIGKNVTAFSGNLQVEDGAAVDGNINAYAENMKINGIVGGDFRGIADHITINGEIKGDVSIETEKLIFGPNAKIGGNLIYTSPEKIDIPKGVVIGDTTYKFKEKTLDEKKLEKGIGVFNVVGKAISMISYLIISFILTLIFSRFMKKTSATMNTKPWHALGIGLLVLIFVPIACLLMMITVIGIPLGIISLILYGLLIYLSKIPAALWIGEKILKNEEKPYLPMVLGLVILLLIGFIPYLGKLISFTAILFGIGSYLLNIKEAIQKPKNIEPLE